MQIRNMTINDYHDVKTLWMGIRGFAIRSIDDSEEGIRRFIERNPKTSVVAVEDGHITGAILCGHDGRRARRWPGAVSSPGVDRWPRGPGPA